jgi:hypothetical protein
VQEPGVIGHELAVEVAADEPVTIEKVVTLFTSRDPAVSEPGHAAAREIARAPKFSELLDRHVLNWHELWRRFGISLEEGEERTHRTVNLHVFHLVQTLSRHTGGIDVGVPARVFTGRRTAATSSGTSSSCSRSSASGFPGSPARCFATAIGGCEKRAGRHRTRATRERCSRGRAEATAARKRSDAT